MPTESVPVEKFVVAVANETWGVFRKEPLTLMLASMLAGLVCVVSLGLLSGVVVVSLVDMVRKVQAGERTTWSDLFARMDALIPGVIVSLVVGLLASVGFLLLVVPGLLVLVFSAFALHVIAFERTTSVDAIKRSVGLVKQHFLHVLVVMLSLSVLHALGGVVFFGVLLAVPLSVIALTVAYERLAQPTEGLSG